jgi:hypothetical protein
MAYAWVRFRPRFPLGGGFPACSSVVEIDSRSSSPERLFCKRWLCRTAQQNEAPSAEFSCPLEEGCSRESCSGGDRISAERGISLRATCLVFAPAVFNRYAEHLRKPVFCSDSILEARRAPGGCWSAVVLRILFPTEQIEYCRSKKWSAGNPPPRGNPGLKQTWTDFILKKFYWKKEF